jgi:hypothetical protein
VSWIKSLFSGDEGKVDSVIFAGLVALAALITMTAVAMYMAPTAFSPGAFAGGAATIIGTVVGGKTARDRWSSNEQPRDQGPGQQPEDTPHA